MPPVMPSKIRFPFKVIGPVLPEVKGGNCSGIREGLPRHGKIL